MERWKEVHAGALALGLALASCGHERAEAKRPNVLLISIDTLRADALSSYGCADATSPNLDRLAERGVLFEDVTSTTSWTLPAHISMLTGLTISAHGICDERLWHAVEIPGGPNELPLHGEYLSESLGRAGYTSGGFYTWKYLDSKFGFGQGFETWRRVGSTVWADGPAHERYTQLMEAGDRDAIHAWIQEDPDAFDQQAPTADQVVDAGLDWIDGHREEPFFLFLHIFDVHDDYVPPAPFDTAFDPDYEGPVDGTKVSSLDSKINGGLPKRDLDHLQALYHGEVAWVDAQIGRLLTELESRGLTEDTLVVVTADHGEEFYEHNHKTHRTQLFRETTAVPLIFSWPGHLPEGQRIAGPVGIVDIAPTVSALADVAPPVSVSGRDLTPIMRGEAPNSETTYLSELMLFQKGSPIPLRHTALLRGDRHWLRIVDREGRASGVWFDRAQNPLETGPGEAFGPGSAEMGTFDALLAPVREATRLQRSLAPSRAALFTEITSTDAKELAGMGYLDGATPVVMQDSERLCLDGCFTQIPDPKSNDSQ
jgi:arylsulfatase A-like enzyme